MKYQVFANLFSLTEAFHFLKHKVLKFQNFSIYYYQNKRGGRVKLQSILMPLSEFDHSEKGDALYGKLVYSELSVNIHFMCLYVDNSM